MSQPKLLFFAGSARTESVNKKLAKLGATIAAKADIPATMIDLRDFPMPIYDGDLEAAEGVPENAHKLKDIIGEHDGVFIATPEYNSSIPPLLKNVIDWLSRIPYKPTKGTVFKGRIVAIGSATAGGTGGVRAMLALRQVLNSSIGAVVLPEQMSVPSADDAFEDDGSLKNPSSEAHFISVIKRLEEVAQAHQ